MDTKFSTAIHTLILISEAEKPMSSEKIAVSVGTNASYIRKITAMLKKGGIIESHRGISGFALTNDPDQVRLLDIYLAVTGEKRAHLFDIHQNPSDTCIVGQNIQPVLRNMFADIESAFERSLADKTLADCIDEMKKQIRQKGESYESSDS